MASMFQNKILTEKQVVSAQKAQYIDIQAEQAYIIYNTIIMYTQETVGGSWAPDIIHHLSYVM